MSKKLEVLLVVIIALNLLTLNSSSFHTKSVSETALNLLKESTDFQNASLLRHGIPQTQSFTNESTLHNWTLNTITPGQVIYFSIDPYESFFQITLYNPLGTQTELDLPIISENYLGSWTASTIGNWTLQVNDTREEEKDDFSYEILASIPNRGYSIESALFLSESVTVANFTIDHEVQYWKLPLDENQDCTVFLKDSTSSVLSESEVTIYSKELGEGNPVSVEEKLSEPLGLYNYSWNAFTKDDYIIEISHKTQYTGLYNISFSAQQDLYNFLTAGRLPYNQTISVHEIHSFVSPKRNYFWFMVNSSRSEVNILICEENPAIDTILESANVEIYDKGFQDPILDPETRKPWSESRSSRDGEINITIHLDEGKYYLVIFPYPGTKGLFYIHFEYRLSQPFIWNPFSIVFSIIILVTLPLYLIYLDSKGKWFRLNQWTIPASLQDTYKFLKNNFIGIFNIKEVPNESILIRVTSIPFKTFALLNFVESSEKDTLVISKRIRRKIEWIIYFFIGLILFDILILLFFILFSAQLLPVYISSSTILILILAIPTASLAIIVLFVNIFVYTNYSQVINRITYIVQNYQNSSEKEFHRKDLDPDQAFKSINYVRVLWNQAKHAFKENNFELFVIKADASVKNLLSTRFQQIISNPISKPDFQVQVATLRKQGFDLPSEKKIAHFRNLRNRIVHSSFTLDEKESVDCFAYYSTFITRLGLRSS